MAILIPDPLSSALGRDDWLGGLKSFSGDLRSPRHKTFRLYLGINSNSMFWGFSLNRRRPKTFLPFAADSKCGHFSQFDFQ